MCCKKFKKFISYVLAFAMIISLSSINAAKSSAADKVITVGKDGCDYTTINDALDAVRKMSREDNERVVIMIDPGNYEEMLVIDTPNVMLKNASETPSIELTNKGVDIDENAVRITWYYGHGYTYYSMDSNNKYNADVLAQNKQNGSASYVNPGAGSKTYWNASVVINANNVTADGIIFENSFNQYVSAKSVEDVIVAQEGAKEGSVPRAYMKTVGDTKVQEKDYVERAAALAIYSKVQKVYFNNCKFVGRQDTLYGGKRSLVAFNKCSIYGGTDYIFGGMTAVFNECDLVFNTNDRTDKGRIYDVGYITAPQQASGRGFLMYNCHITSTTPGVDTTSERTSKPGYFGRPWQGNTSEVVFYNTRIDKSDPYWDTSYINEKSPSLIVGPGWKNGLSDGSPWCVEYNTIEASNVNNSYRRDTAVSGGVLSSPVLADGTEISIEAFLGEWDPFNEYVLDVEPEENEDVIVESTPEPDKPVSNDDVVDKPAQDVPADNSDNKQEIVDSNQNITNQYVDAGTSFVKFKLKAVGKNKAVKLSWNKVSDADVYAIYGSENGKPSKVLKEVPASDKSCVIKKLGKGKYYKFTIVAYKYSQGKKYKLATSEEVCCATTGGKYGNPQKIVLNKTKITLKVGKNITLKPKYKADKKVKQLFAKFRYELSNTDVAKVNKKGVISGVKKGKCDVYIYTQNGLYKRVRVSVK